MKSKSIATLLAFLLGGFGIHRFYLRQQKLGWYYLIFCWTLLPLLIGIFDGLMLSFSNYASFNRKYNLGHAFRKKFEDDQAILDFNTDEKLEKEFLEKLEAMPSRESVEEYLLQAKANGEYLPRAVYAKARKILGSQQNIYPERLDIG